ncbi:MAG: Synerg-CTERM sorting domain-containing protein [Synergistes jonesii]|uniref:Synerg-CTERM sorting domain-containing protein n=1 Tax=Synergistes jonesii TaxID=2754 RepID=UPI002A74F3F8|nr:Synerg-CTERM sorting domain-containing protein [Synergistes jonesii]MDY2984946.1 Synerg-CTERM sorting domain-containing protein [Synergistes jonesii]
MKKIRAISALVATFLLVAALSAAAAPRSVTIDEFEYDGRKCGDFTYYTYFAKLDENGWMSTPCWYPGGNQEPAAAPTAELLAPFIPAEYTGDVVAETLYRTKFMELPDAPGKMPAGGYEIMAYDMPPEWQAEMNSADLFIIVDSEGKAVSADHRLGQYAGNYAVTLAQDYAYSPSIYALKLTHTPLPKYAVTASAGANGAVTPASADVEEGYAQDFEVKADEGYLIKSLTLDGAAVAEAAGLGAYVLTLENVTAAHKIAAEFELAPLPTFAITASASENGTITPSGEVTVEQGAEQAFEIKAKEWYVIDKLTVDGKDESAAADAGSYVYTFKNVTAAHTIAATFKRAHSDGGGGGCNAGMGAVALLALAPFVLRRKK